MEANPINDPLNSLFGAEQNPSPKFFAAKPSSLSTHASSFLSAHCSGHQHSISKEGWQSFAATREELQRRGLRISIGEPSTSMSRAPQMELAIRCNTAPENLVKTPRGSVAVILFDNDTTLTPHIENEESGETSSASWKEEENKAD